MKNIFIYVALILTLALSSCWVEEENSEKINTNSESETNQVIDDINQEIDNIENTNSWETSSQNNTESQTKVVEINKNYDTPHWDHEEVKFTITLNDNIIEDIKAETIKWVDYTHTRIASFSDHANELLKWKTIEEAWNIWVIWWSSLTTEAFKLALKDL